MKKEIKRKQFDNSEKFGKMFDVVCNSGIEFSDICIFTRIHFLTFKFGYCSASNQSIANHFKKSKDTIKRSIARLKEKEFIIIKCEYTNKIITKRKIYINQNIKALVNDV